MKYLSLFSGIGGFERGIELSNKGNKLNCIGYSEVDKYAENIYKKHYPNHIRLGDVTKIRTKDLPDFELLVGGFPCQAFSVAGKRGGFNDTRGTLFFEIARILKDKKPAYFLLENVPGLLSHDKGRTIATIFGTLADLGYYVKWEVYNSKDHGVPQNRKRIYIKGYFRKKCGPEILSQQKTNRKNNNLTNNKIIRVNEKPKNKRDHEHYRLYSEKGISPTLTVSKSRSMHIMTKEKERKIKNIGNIFPSKAQNGNIYDPSGISPTMTRGIYKNGIYINENQNHELKNMTKEIDENTRATTTKEGNLYAVTTKPRQMPFKKRIDNYIIETQQKAPECTKDNNNPLPPMRIKKTEFGKDSKTLVNPDSICPTLCHDGQQSGRSIYFKVKNKTRKGYLEAEEGGGVIITPRDCRGRVQKQSSPTLNCRSDVGTLTSDYKIRRLTPVECERLQGFPDDWTKYGADGAVISDTQRYKCIGNAVTVNVISAIFDGWDIC